MVHEQHIYLLHINATNKDIASIYILTDNVTASRQQLLKTEI